MVSPQGYRYGKDPKSDNPFWTDEEIKEEITATASVDNSTGTPSVDVTKNGYNFDFSFHNLKGEKGDNGVNGQNGQDGKNGINGKSPVVTSTGDTGSGKVAGTITGADGTKITVYNGEKGEIPDIGNVLAEVTDSIVENAAYDHHTLKETKHNGTQNNVGSFYIARKQITSLETDGSFTTVDQNGNTEDGMIKPEPELQPWAPVTGTGDYVNGWPIKYTQTVKNCNADSDIVVTLENSLNDIRTNKASSKTHAVFRIDPLRTGFTTDIQAGQLATYPSFIIPYVGEALSGTSHISHTFYGASDYSIQSPILELSVTPVFNSDGSATFTITIKGFYMNKITNETITVGAGSNQSTFPLISISLKEK